jgi:hypothetical protein
VASLNMAIKLHKGSFKYLFIVVQCESENHSGRAAQRGTERGEPQNIEQGISNVEGREKNPRGTWTLRGTEREVCSL